MITNLKSIKCWKIKMEEKSLEGRILFFKKRKTIFFLKKKRCFTLHMNSEAL
jgi:hypothetical protein